MCGEKVDIQHAKGPGHKARDRRDSGRPIVRDARRADRRSRSRDRRRRSDSRDRRSYHSRVSSPFRLKALVISIVFERTYDHFFRVREEVEPHHEDILHHEEPTSLKSLIFPPDAGKSRFYASQTHLLWWPTNLLFRWQDLKDEIRAQTKIECSFCEIHTPRDREGIGKMSQWDFVIYFLFSLLQQKR